MPEGPRFLVLVLLMQQFWLFLLVGTLGVMVVSQMAEQLCTNRK